MDSVHALEVSRIDLDDDVAMEEQYLEENPLADCTSGEEDREEDPEEGNKENSTVNAWPYEWDEHEFDDSATQDQLDGSAGGVPPKKPKNKRRKDKADGQKDLFSCTLAVYKREFKGQTSGAYIAHWEVSGNSKVEFISNVWRLSSDYLNREVVFESNPGGETTPRWSTKEKPTEEDFKQFALFQSARRPYTVDNVLDNKQHLLQSWRGKEISLFLHVYSLSVNNKSLWVKVKDSLIEPSEHDRAGAATTKALLELTKQLRKQHEEFLKGNDMAWSFWANAIHSAPAHKRSELMQYPPDRLSSLFSIQEGVRMNAVRHELETASNVSESYHDDISEVRKAFDSLQELQVMIDRGMQTLANRIERLEIRERTSSSLINSMKTSVVVQENDVGKGLKKQVSDCFDHQHAP